MEMVACYGLEMNMGKIHRGEPSLGFYIGIQLAKRHAIMVTDTLMQCGELKVAMQIEGIRCGPITKIPAGFTIPDGNSESVSEILTTISELRHTA